MRVLLVHNRYRSVGIGGEDVVFERERSALARSLGESNILIYAPSNDDIRPLEGLLETFSGGVHLRNVHDIITSKHVDIMHVHNTVPRITPLIFGVAKRLGVATVMTVHNYRHRCLNGLLYRQGHGICFTCPRSGSLLPGVAYGCYRGSVLQGAVLASAQRLHRVMKAFDSVDRFLVLTQTQREILTRLGFPMHRVELKPNHIPDDLRNRSPIFPDDRSGFVFVGRLEEAKGAASLVRLWSEFPSSMTLKIIGVGPDRDRIHRIKPNNVTLLGRLSQTETMAEISRSRFLVQPSLWYETFGLSIVEAMARGVPVIGLDIGTRSELIQHGANGFLARNWSQMREILVAAHTCRDYDALSAGARQASQRFAERDMTERLIRIYQELRSETLP